MSRARALALVAVLALAACEGVPSLSFTEPDATMVAADDASEDSAASAADGETPMTDAAPDATGAALCPSAPPPNASVCCGAVPCNGTCQAAQCSLCQSCEGGFCCAKQNNVVCKPLEVGCP